MGDKFINFLKKPEVEQTLLSQQKEMLGTSSTSDDDDEYEDFLCEDKTEFSTNNREISMQKKLEMDNNEMLYESCCSHDEDFRVRDVTPQPNGEQTGSAQNQPNLAEMFQRHATILSDDDDYICISSPPKSTEVPSFESIFNEIPSESVIPSPIGDFSNKYERDALLQIRRSKTAEEWKSFLWTNHGANWPIDEMPFEMDSDLRCPFHERINILRERQEAARQFFSLSRPQTDIQLTGDLATDRRYQKIDYSINNRTCQNKKNEQKKSKHKNKKNKKAKSIGGVEFQSKIKGENKENAKIDQTNKDCKKDWTDSEECDESSGNEEIKKKPFGTSSVPNASKWAIKYFENITSSENEEQEDEQNVILDKKELTDKIANRHSLVGFPFWHKDLDHPGWQRSKNVLEFYFNRIKKDILEVNDKE
ncbi:hypothetical protein Mgra_00002320 [Meloidogyne graminicola]|uniref:Uncharacterized protein n=1 Tax=Meloidogyne graminicola TaxID=189291 RepID=A0A8S9ZX79_9BILA|nr:hypothetical protein Mgra_00002320 [Meloidogyne graminicola]